MISRVAWIFLLSVIQPPSPAAAEEISVQPGPQPDSLQRQIDELKAGQLRLTEELAAIRQLLQDKPSRADYRTKPQFPGVLHLNVKGEPFKGASTARFAVINYSDFDCSHCASFARELFPKLEATYLRSGKVRYYSGDLPDSLSTNAISKARAARCAAEENRFWEMHDALLEHVDQPAPESIAAAADKAGLDRLKLRACLESGRYEEEIRRGTTAARRVGLIGTPAFLVGTLSENGEIIRATRLVLGGETYEPLREAIDAVIKEGLP